MTACIMVGADRVWQSMTRHFVWGQNTLSVSSFSDEPHFSNVFTCPLFQTPLTLPPRAEHISWGPKRHCLLLTYCNIPRKISQIHIANKFSPRSMTNPRHLGDKNSIAFFPHLCDFCGQSHSEKMHKPVAGEILTQNSKGKTHGCCLCHGRLSES